MSHAFYLTAQGRGERRIPRSGDTQDERMSHAFYRTAQEEEKAAYLVPETLKVVRPSLCSVRGKRHSLLNNSKSSYGFRVK